MMNRILLLVGLMMGLQAQAQVSEDLQSLMGHEAESFGFLQTEFLRCESVDYRRTDCAVSGRLRGVRMLRQYSKSGCVMGRTWGFIENFVWVDRGCRAQFEIVVEYPDHGRHHDRDRHRDDDRHRDNDRNNDRHNDHGRHRDDHHRDRNDHRNRDRDDRSRDRYN